MKKHLALLSILLIGGITIAQSSLPAFPMTLYGDIKIGSTNVNEGTLKIYNGSNEIGSYNITESGKYGSENVYIPTLLLNSFEGNLSFKLIYNGKTLIIDSIDDSNKGTGCPSKSNITFTSANCRYDLTFKEEKSDSGNTSTGGGSGGGGGGGGGSNKSDTKTTTGNTSTQTTTGNISISTGNNAITTGKNIPLQQVNTNQGEGLGTQTNKTQWSRYHEGDQQKKLSHGYTLEQTNAYTFARINNITTAENLYEANLTGKLTRIAMAKMLSNYAINVLGKKPDTSRKPFFDDVSDGLNSKYDHGATHAYQLGIMGIGISSFRPNDVVTRGEFATALSRMLYDTPDGKDKYYSTHLNVLYNKGIISNADPKMKEIRGYVMLMLMRSAMK